MAHTPVIRRRSPSAPRTSEEDALVVELRRHAAGDWTAVTVAANAYLDARRVTDPAFRRHLIRESTLAVATHLPTGDAPALTARVLATIDRALSEQPQTPASAVPAARAPASAPEADGAVVHCPTVYGRQPMRPQRLDYPQLVPPVLRDIAARLLAAAGAAATSERRS